MSLFSRFLQRTFHIRERRVLSNAQEAEIGKAITFGLSVFDPKASDQIDAVREQLKHQIDRQDWLSQDVRDAAKAKIDTLSLDALLAMIPTSASA